MEAEQKKKTSRLEKWILSQQWYRKPNTVLTRTR